jgi:hypothetical protein
LARNRAADGRPIWHLVGLRRQVICAWRQRRGLFAIEPARPVLVVEIKRDQARQVKEEVYESVDEGLP